MAMRAGTGRIVVVNPSLTQRMRERIREIAAKAGNEVVFCNTNAEAVPYMSQARAAYGRGADLTRAGAALEWFHSVSAGVDAYLQEGAIANPAMVLTNSSGAYGVTLAEHTLMVTLEILRRQPEYERAVARRQWLGGLEQKTIRASRVTVLGTGDLGCEIAKRFAAFEPETLVGVNRSGKSDCPYFTQVCAQQAAEEILPKTDILVMCLPGTEQTRHFMDETRIGLLPADAVLVNVGRGNALDPAALAKALSEGRLRAAALDVFEQEPLPENDPLWDCPNLLITPHIAGNLTASWTLERNVELFCANLERFLKGEALEHVVNRERGY